MLASGGDVNQRHSRALGEQACGCSTADVPEAAGDGNDLAIQSIHESPAFVAPAWCVLGSALLRCAISTIIRPLMIS
jgi:hypothetical protein